jgi:hypothetical protein
VGGWTEGVIPKDARLDSTATAEIYDPATGRSKPTRAMNIPRAYHTATLLKDGRVLIAGGYLENQGLDTLEIFDPHGETFTILPVSLTVGRSSHSANLLPDGSVLFAGGYSLDNSATDRSDLFDLANLSMTEGPRMETARGAHAAVALSKGKVLFMWEVIRTPGDYQTSLAKMEKVPQRLKSMTRLRRASLRSNP